LPCVSSITDERNRLSLASDELQTSQSQAITGTPCEVPVPKNVIFNAYFFVKVRKAMDKFVKKT
jgi:hypothetical protein